MASPLSCISLGSNEEEIRWRENENGILSFLLVVPRERERMEEEKKENGDRFWEKESRPRQGKNGVFIPLLVSGVHMSFGDWLA